MRCEKIKYNKNAKNLVFFFVVGYLMDCRCLFFYNFPSPLITLRKILIRNKIKLFAGQLIISILSATWHRYETLILSLARSQCSQPFSCSKKNNHQQQHQHQNKIQNKKKLKQKICIIKWKTNTHLNYSSWDVLQPQIQ